MAKRREFGSIRKLPSGRFQAHYTYRGERHLADRRFKTRGDASRWLSGVETSLSRGTWVHPKVEAPTVHIFEVYADTWIAQRDLRPRTRALYRSLMDRLLRPTFGPLEITAITPKTVREWHAGLDSTPTQNAHAYSLLRTILSTAVDDEIIGRNPCKIEKAAKAQPVKRVEVLTAEQVEELAEHMPPRYRALTLVTAFACLRFGEGTELRRGDYVDGKLRVHRGVAWLDGEALVDKPKTEAGIRTVPLLPFLRPILEEHLATFSEPGEDGLIFPSTRGGQIKHSALMKVFNKAKVEIGRPDLTWHDLRHTGAVIWAGEPSMTLKDLMALLGHTTIEMALHYQHVAKGKLEDVAERLNGLIRGEAA